ncbi:MAG TPA: serine/threonine-protein kinase [Actinoplanes sp.]
MAEQVLGGRFALLDRLGTGGMSVVWRARDEILGRTVAVKVLAGRYADDPDSRDRIRDEARAAAALSHPNVAQVYDYGEADVAGARVPYVVMELLRGGTLQGRLAGGPVPPRFAMRVCAEVAAALAAAHADGLVHRDIKPANVMITPDGVKVVDFGIAAATGSAARGDGTVIGTPAYVAPERLIQDAVEPASDVYALGVLLYRLLSGHAPWSADTTTQMLSAHIYVEPEPLAPLPDVPDYVIDLCNRCLHKDPTQRPSAREAASLLARGAGLRVVGDEPPPATAERADEEPSLLIRPPAGTPLMLLRNGGTPPAADPAPVPPPSVPGSRRRALPVVIAALLAIAGAVTVLFLPDDRRDAGSVAATVADPATGVERPTTVQAVTPSASRRPASAAAGGTADRAAPVQATIATAGPTTVPVGTSTAGTPPTATPTHGEPSATATTTRPGPPPPPPPKERTLSSAGGTVRAVCPKPSTAHLLSWKAKKPYRVGSVDPGPAAVTSVVFVHDPEGIKMTITCRGGVPETSNESV